MSIYSVHQRYQSKTPTPRGAVGCGGGEGVVENTFIQLNLSVFIENEGGGDLRGCRVHGNSSCSLYVKRTIVFTRKELVKQKLFKVYH